MEALEKEMIKQLVKMEPAYWKETDPEITYQEMLRKRTKEELSYLRRVMKIPNVSQFSKKDLVSYFDTVKGRMVAGALEFLDTKQLHFIQQAAENGYAPLRAAQITRVRWILLTGLCTPGTIEGTPVMVVPHDLRETVLSKAHLPEVKKQAVWNTEILELVTGLVQIYGVLSSQEVFSYFLEYGMLTKEDQFFQAQLLLYKQEAYYEQYEIHEDYFVRAGMEHVAASYTKINLRKDIAPIKLTKAQVIQQSRETSIIKEKEYVTLGNYLKKEYGLKQVTIDNLLDHLAFLNGESAHLDELLLVAMEYVPVKGATETKQLSRYLRDAANATPQWQLKGHSPNQLARMGHRRINNEDNEVKVGRNDPCPCGSGKKYKKCCGGNA